MFWTDVCNWSNIGITAVYNTVGLWTSLRKYIIQEPVFIGNIYVQLTIRAFIGLYVSVSS